jgi:hypothetical protein
MGEGVGVLETSIKNCATKLRYGALHKYLHNSSSIIIAACSLTAMFRTQIIFISSFSIYRDQVRCLYSDVQYIKNQVCKLSSPPRRNLVIFCMKTETNKIFINNCNNYISLQLCTPGPNMIF